MLHSKGLEGGCAMRAGLVSRVTQVKLTAGMGCLLVAVAAGAYEEGAVTGGGTITGVVRIVGEATALPAQPVYKHLEECGTSVPDERLVVGENGVLRNVVVTVDGITRGKPLPTTSVVLDNRKCAFVPHVLTACTGQSLHLVNQDPFLHDAHAWLGDRTLFNLAIPRGRTVRTQLQDAGLIHINCNVRHTWMHAYLFVADHPYHTVTDAEGRFSITDVPAGTQRLRVWHELLGSAEQAVVVPAGGPVHVDFGLATIAPADVPPDTP
jgi:plastocyanin